MLDLSPGASHTQDMARPGDRDLEGERFGLLVVLCLEDQRVHGKRVWLCLCDCGEANSVTTGRLVNDWTKSCGCLGNKPGGRGHGDSRRGVPWAPEYVVWTHMRQRCSNPKDKEWHNYGGRGIRVCLRWENSYQAFLDDVGRRPAPDLTLDRIDNDSDYRPGNTRWATRKEQLRNFRRNRLITFREETLPVVVWAERTGISSHAIRRRLDRGWPVEMALTAPLYFRPRPDRLRSPDPD